MKVKKQGVACSQQTDFRSAMRAYLMQFKSMLEDESPRRLELKGYPISMHSLIISTYSLPAAILSITKLGN